eukprot:gnl/TRDRNA2_/TRDRNA2_169203_c3_seq1.p2 gnl/TRDRNA2_/TRDRNA2_169203_c3~~gnl/TRDRNA2_/TRDRNA2_169203_c3_seq1.p2  ORF type:complete len:111 (+),score=14.73 gnl/TRDRNA2_/TRDRNA2_169203_c3_seq1:93-425(+)
MTSSADRHSAKMRSFSADVPRGARPVVRSAPTMHGVQEAAPAAAEAAPANPAAQAAADPEAGAEPEAEPSAEALADALREAEHKTDFLQRPRLYRQTARMLCSASRTQGN